MAHIFEYLLASGQHMCQDHDAALNSINSAPRHLPALGNRGSHKLMHEQGLSKRDVHGEGRLHASLDAEYQRQVEERGAEHQESGQRMETDLRCRAETPRKAHAAPRRPAAPRQYEPWNMSRRSPQGSSRQTGVRSD
ncbi:hypothetical protein AB0B12_11445 [Streptomyces sp. NPDC044780]|uniref:hypothetical protein n=1 Tax=unclassified Streptomyces TaxID=2593676 RepID=UPI0033F27846